MAFNKSLNPLVSNLFRRRLNRRDLERNETRYNIMREGSLSPFDAGYLEGTKVYKGIALYIEGAEDNSWFFKTLEQTTPASTEATQFYRVRVRIPELHAHIPEPCGVGSDEPNRAQIEMHPVFVGRSTSTEEPKPGDIVEVSFTKGPQGGIQAGGIYHGIFQSSVGGESGGATSVCLALQGLFDALPRSVTQLQDLPVSDSHDDTTAHPGNDIEHEVIDPATGQPVPEGGQPLFSTTEEIAERQQVFVTGPFASPAYVTSEFGPREAPTAGGSTNHLGTDFRADEWTPLYALFSGKVIEKGTNTRIGGFIKIGHFGSDGKLQYTARYLHLNGWAEGLEVGSEVRAWQHIAMSGNTGTISEAQHLHLEIKDYIVAPDYGRLVDCREYLPPNAIINSIGTPPPPRGSY